MPTSMPTPRAVIHRAELDLIGRWTLDHPDCETGGDLFGFFTHSGHPVVQYVLGPGPGARRTTTSFFQDRDFLVEAGRLLRDLHGLQHIGEWHSHHRLGLYRPSTGDELTVARARQAYRLPSFLLGIATVERRASSDAPCIAAYLFSGDDPRAHSRCGWVVLPGASPVRADPDLTWIYRLVAPRRAIASTDASPRMTLGDAAPVELPLRASSWLRTAPGTALLRRIVAVLGASGTVRMRPTADGLLELELDAAAVRLLAVWEDDTTHARATVRVTILDDDAGEPFERTSGALEIADLLARIVSGRAATIERAATPAPAACAIDGARIAASDASVRCDSESASSVHEPAAAAAAQEPDAWTSTCR